MRKSCSQILLLLLLFFPTLGLTNITEASPVVGYTESGIPYHGSLDAPVVLIEYSDYLCPFCARYHKSAKPVLIQKYVDTGKLRFEFRHFPLAKLHPTASKGHEAAACAGQQSIQEFWKFHDMLFDRQSDWSRLSDPAPFLDSLAEELGIEKNKWQSCLEDREQKKRVDDDITLGESLEFNGTPTFQIRTSARPDKVYTIVGARSADHFSGYVDALLDGKPPPKPPEKPKPELPAWAKTNALAIDPDRPGYTASGDPTYGAPEARLVIVEFTDYQCPACGRHASETQPAIDESLIETGKVRWVSKQLPLPQHANAIAAAAAAICAGDQGKFRDMHNVLFANQEIWSALDNPDKALIDYSVDLNLNVAAFTRCLGSRGAVERIVNSVYEATRVTRATPVFVVLDGETGRPIRGAKKPEEFISLVEEKLKKVLKSDSEKLLDNAGDKSK